MNRALALVAPAAVVTVAVVAGVSFVSPEWGLTPNEERLQNHLDEEYGFAKYNVLGCEGEGPLPDESVKCEVHRQRGRDDDWRDSWTVVVEFDGNDVR